MNEGPILITGRSGQMAQALLRACRGAGREAIALGRDELDLTDRDEVLERVGTLAPPIIFNTAAYTAVDRAEAEPATALALNRDGARYIAEAAALAGARLVHFSTDYVFSGHEARPQAESDRPDPLGVYGQSKLAGEMAVREALPGAAILRTSSIFSPMGSNFVRTMMRLAQEKDEVRVVDDQITAPTPAEELAALVLRLSDSTGSGVFHAAGRPQVSWAGFAGAVFEAMARRGHDVPRLIPVTTAQFGAPAPRPAYSVLADTRLDALVGPWTLDWRPALERTVDALLGER